MEFLELLKTGRPVLLDGGMGTMLQARGLPVGAAPETAALEHPEWLREIHSAYLDAGSQIVYANTFGANREKLAHCGRTVAEVVPAAVSVAREAARGRGLVALDVGPIGQLLEPTGTLEFEQAVDIFAEVVEAGAAAGADLIAIETMTDLQEARAALLAAREHSSLPVLVTMTYEATGRTFLGCSPACAALTLEGLGADANQQEALFLIDDATYLHIQPCDSSWDYTLYDAASMKEMDGGQLDMPEISRMKAVFQICDDNDLGGGSVKYAPLSMIETLQEAAYQQMQAEVGQMAVSSQLPEAQEQALDEYPMPDEQVSTPDMQEYGYSYDGMLPVTRERALELDAAGLTVYVLHEDNTESMVFDPQEIMDHGGLFGVDREEWEKSPQFHEKVMERQEHQQEREQAFLSRNRDCFAIYQVKHTDELRDIRYEGMDWLRSIGQTVKRENYDLVYTAPLEPCKSPQAAVEQLYNQFNNDHPADYHHPSMSVSDIVAIKQDGKVSCHYCDSVGFTQIPGFLSQNPLKNAEMAVEDDYGMIDGIINNGAKEPTVAELEQQARSGQPISLMDLADAVHREEREKKKSVVDQLKSQPKAEHKKTAPKKSAEREI